MIWLFVFHKFFYYVINYTILIVESTFCYSFSYLSAVQHWNQTSMFNSQKVELCFSTIFQRQASIDIIWFTWKTKIRNKKVYFCYVSITKTSKLGFVKERKGCGILVEQIQFEERVNVLLTLVVVLCLF